MIGKVREVEAANIAIGNREKWDRLVMGLDQLKLWATKSRSRPATIRATELVTEVGILWSDLGGIDWYRGHLTAAFEDVKVQYPSRRKSKP
jgi:hypothetical protein